MKKKLYYKTFLMLAAAAAVSCASSGEEAAVTEYGTLDLGAITASVSSEDAAEATRAITDAPDDFVVTVSGSRGVVMGPAPVSELPATLPLPVGKYTIEASSPTLVDAGWECPWYYGSGEVTVVKGVVTTPDPIVCTLGNVKVTVRFSDDLKSHLGDDVVVSVNIAGGGEWQFTPANMQAAYLKIPAEGADMTVTFTGSIDGTVDDPYSKTITVRPGEWERVRFTFEENEGERTFHIIIFDSSAGQIGDGSDWF